MSWLLWGIRLGADKRLLLQAAYVAATFHEMEQNMTTQAVRDTVYPNISYVPDIKVWYDPAD